MKACICVAGPEMLIPFLFCLVLACCLACRLFVFFSNPPSLCSMTNVKIRPCLPSLLLMPLVREKQRGKREEKQTRKNNCTYIYAPYMHKKGNHSFCEGSALNSRSMCSERSKGSAIVVSALSCFSQRTTSDLHPSPCLLLSWTFVSIIIQLWTSMANTTSDVK